MSLMMNSRLAGVYWGLISSKGLTREEMLHIKPLFDSSKADCSSNGLKTANN